MFFRSWQNVGITGKDFITDYRSTVGSFDNSAPPFNKTQSKTWLQILLENEDKLIKPVEAIPLLCSTMKFLKRSVLIFDVYLILIPEFNLHLFQTTQLELFLRRKGTS